MERTEFFEEPTDEEINAFLDGELAAASERPPDDAATTEEPDPSDVDEEDSEDLDDDAADDDEAAEDEDADESDDEDEDDDDLPDPRDLKRQLDALTAEREREREQVKQALTAVTAEQQRQAVATTLLEIKERMTTAEWTAFSAQLTEGYKDHQIRALRQEIAQRDQAVQDQQFYAAENAALDQIISELGKELKGNLSDLEETVIRQSRDVAELDANIRRIVTARRQMTEPARRAKAEQRRQSGADRAGLRQSGGAKASAKTYDNFDPKQFDAYMDDVLAGAR